MRLEEHQSAIQSEHQSKYLLDRLQATAFETDLQYVGEGDPFSRQLEIVNQVADQHRSIADLARRLGVEEQQVRYP
jgi:hypothetical protein